MIAATMTIGPRQSQRRQKAGRTATRHTGRSALRASGLRFLEDSWRRMREEMKGTKLTKESFLIK